MKNLLFTLLTSIFIAFTQQATAQNFQESIHKSIPLSNRKLVSIQNLKGFVTIEAYKGNTVEFDIEKKVSASSAEEVERGKREVSIVIEERADTIISYISAPHAEWRGYRYGNVNFSDEEETYTFDFSIKVRVPEQVNIDVSSIGNVSITDVKGTIKARAHQGLKLVNITGKATASAHHGDMEVSYASPIPASSSFRTHHGDIRISVPKEPDADIVFDSFHGDCYTDFTNIQSLPPQLNTSVSTKEGGKSYKIEQIKALRLGKGGINLDFKSHHGSFYLLSKK